MSVSEQVLTIALCVAGTMLTRFLPFLLFRESRPTPPLVQYLGRALPGAIFAMLVIYCLKDVPLLAAPHALPEALAIAVTTFVHLWRRNFLLSIACGTFFYMLLVQFLFTAS